MARVEISELGKIWSRHQSCEEDKVFTQFKKKTREILSISCRSGATLGAPRFLAHLNRTVFQERLLPPPALTNEGKGLADGKQCIQS